MTGRRFLRAIVVGVVMCGSTTVLAAPWEPKGKPARELMKQGRAAFGDGKYADAAALFLRSVDAEDTNNARWNAGQALAAAGDWRRALDLFDALAKDSTVPKDRRDAIKERRRVASVFVAADYAAEAQRWDDATAVLRKLIDDPALGERDRAGATAILATVATKRADTEASRRRDEEAAREAEASKLPPVVTAPIVPERTPSHGARPSRMSDTVALVLVGGGVVGLGVGGGLMWNAGLLDDDASSESDQRRRVELQDSADTRRIAGGIALGVGGALLIAGAIKLAIPPSMPRASIATVRRVDGGAVVVLGGSFW